MTSELDPVDLELIRNRLVSGAEKMSLTLWRSSYSTVIREVLDYSTALFSADGSMVAQSAQLPFQMMTMSGPLKQAIAKVDVEPGDVLLLNDPHAAGAQHLPDFMMFRPVHADDQLIGFAGAVAHMIDTGGGAAGSYVAGATEIFHEGLRIPAVKICAAGTWDNDLYQVILLNVREPYKVAGDMRAMRAATEIGATEMAAVAERYGNDYLTAAMRSILDGSEELLRNRIAAVPDGTCTAVDFVDDDGITDEPVRLQAAVTISGGTVAVDLTGSASQTRGPINATIEMTETTVVYVLMAVFGEGIPKNDGCRRVVQLVAPDRSVVNAKTPAPVASRVTTCHRLVDVLLQALADVVPDQVVAGYYGVSNICNIGGVDPPTGEPWVHFEIEVGGWGARPTKDGLDGFSAHIHNLANTPVEVVESTVPLLVERYGFRDDSGGQGRFRGGLGLRRDIRLLAPRAELNLLGDRSHFHPPGLQGGEPGAGGRYVLNPGTDDERVMPNKIANYPMMRGDVISMETPGGGGYGHPPDRDADAAARDALDGKTTRSATDRNEEPHDEL